MIESKNKMTADELLQIFIAGESGGRELNSLLANGRLMYYSFKQGVKYYKDLSNLIDN